MGTLHCVTGGAPVLCFLVWPGIGSASTHAFEHGIGLVSHHVVYKFPMRHLSIPDYDPKGVVYPVLGYSPFSYHIIFTPPQTTNNFGMTSINFSLSLSVVSSGITCPAVVGRTMASLSEVLTSAGVQRNLQRQISGRWMDS